MTDQKWVTRVLTTKGQRGELFRVMEKFYSSAVVVVTQLCLSQPKTVFLKRMNFTTCKLDLKPDLKIIIRLGVRGVDVTGVTLMIDEARWWVDGDLLDSCVHLMFEIFHNKKLWVFVCLLVVFTLTERDISV